MAYLCYNSSIKNVAVRGVPTPNGSNLMELGHMSIILPLKRCASCGIEYPRTNEHFYKDKCVSDGLSYSCKLCSKRRSLDYIARHQQEHRDYQRQYVKDCPDKIKAINEREKELRKTDPERIRARDRAKYHKNPKKATERTLRYQRNHPEVRSYHDRKKTAKRNNAEGTYTKTDIELLYRTQKAKCWHCGISIADKYHIDHLIPLSRGGTNWPNNLVLACPKCNMSKGSKLTHEWNGKLF